MTHKVYEYEGKHYCEEDISLTDPKYAGDIWDLYWILHREGHIEENRTYYLPEYPDNGIYEDEEEAVLDNLETFDINVCGEYDDDDPGDDIDADGRTRCPIEEHYALPKDGYCHLWEKRNITDDDYPERRTDGRD